MALVVKPEPFSSEVNRLFSTVFGPVAAQAAQPWSPAMDLLEADDAYVLKADVPGVSEDDLQIEIHNNTLTVAGERRSDHARSERGWHRVERTFGRFSRSLHLPEGVNADGVSASFDRGVLEIRIPKPAQPQPRRVQITVNDTATQPTVEGTASETISTPESAPTPEPATA